MEAFLLAFIQPISYLLKVNYKKNILPIYIDLATSCLISILGFS